MKRIQEDKRHGRKSIYVAHDDKGQHIHGEGPQMLKKETTTA